jgi:hypothetical protein
MFTRDSLLASDWYAKRLEQKQAHDVRLWRRHVDYLNGFMGDAGVRDEADHLHVTRRREHAQAELAHLSSPEYLKSLVGTLGVDLSIG